MFDLQALADLHQRVNVVLVELQVGRVHVVQNLPDAAHILNGQMENIVLLRRRVLEQRAEETNSFGSIAVITSHISNLIAIWIIFLSFFEIILDLTSRVTGSRR